MIKHTQPTVMSNIYQALCISLMIMTLASCQKSDDELLDPSNPPGTSTPDSIVLLKSIKGDHLQGDDFDFHYDDQHQLTMITRPYKWAGKSPFYIFYKDGKVSNIIAQADIKKASVIFQYGANKKCSKAYYKRTRNRLENNDPYFTSLSDGEFEGRDSLVYNATDQLIEVHSFNYYSKPGSIVKYFYANVQDSAANKLEEYHLDANDNWYLYDKLLIAANNIDNPACKLLWYFPFLNKIATIAGSGSNAISLPLLFDDPSTYLDGYLSFVPKCITHYEVYNSWGVYNYTSTYFDYAYSADALRLTSTKKISQWPYYVNYNFEKKKR